MKILGGLILLSGFTYWGFYQANRLAVRLQTLRAVEQTLLVLESQIDYAQMSIPECFEKIGHTFHEDYICDFYIDMASALQQRYESTFDTIWKEAVNRHLKKNELKNEDCEVIGLVGEIPLYLNKEIQITMIGNCRNRLLDRIRGIENVYDSRCKIYRIFGLAVGCLSLLVLI